MFRMNRPLFLLLCGVSTILLSGFPGLSRAQGDDSSAPEIEVNRSVLDDLDGYTPPPMFGSPEKPVLSRPLKSIPLPSLTAPRSADGGVSRRDDYVDEKDGATNGLTPEQIEENRQRGLAHPIIEDAPKKKTVTRMTSGKKKPKDAPGQAPSEAAAPPPSAPVKTLPLPIRKPAMATASPAPDEKVDEPPAQTPPKTVARPEKRPEIKPAEPPAPPPAPPPPEPETAAKTGTGVDTGKKTKQVIPPSQNLMPALPPGKVETEGLGHLQGDSGDITAYDASADAESHAAKQKDISSAKAPGASPPDRPPPQPAPAQTPKLPEKAPPEETAKTPTPPESSKPPENLNPPEKAPASDAAPSQAPGKSAISFEKGKSDLTPEQTDILSAGALASLKAGERYRVQIQAYATAADEGQSSARRVSLLRALSVRAWLVGQGVDPRRIDVRALGNQGGESGTADRVDLIVFDPRNPP